MIESQRSLTEDVSGRCGQVSAGLAGGPMRGLMLYPLFGWRNLAMAGYIKFDGVDGEFQDKDHKNWSVIEAFSQVISKPGNGTGVTRRRGDVVLADIAVTKQLDKSSPKLAESVCKGKVFPKVEIDVTASYTDAGRVTFYRYELKNVQITSYSISGGTSSGQDHSVMEQLMLNFEEIKVTYTECDNAGKKKGNAEYTWKVEEGKS
jgi:type VI secretion system secreted protein Hcp